MTIQNEFIAKKFNHTAGAVLLMILLLSTSFSFGASIRTAAIVKLYSDGKLAATWEAVDKGRQDGNCYVFHVRKGAHDREVRVCGTFSVEQIR